MKVSYSKTLRDRAREKEKGLITIDVSWSDGLRSTTQLIVEDDVCDFLGRIRYLLEMEAEKGKLK